ncbi:hypothetical protein KSS87_012784 [Heliosperma pusillum]|nr:hypothetical protein KSS87_012784 [Heliosperma pusillum]
MSSEIGQNPSVNISNNIAPKVTKQVVTKNKFSKKFAKNKNNKNKDNISNQSKPLKVVYISNPVKFKVNADEFLALVQGLTGRDATEWTEDNNINTTTTTNNNNNNSALDVGPSTYSHGGVHHNDDVQQKTLMIDDYQLKVDDYHEPSEMSLDYFGSLDGDEDKGQMIDYYQGFPTMYD